MFQLILGISLGIILLFVIVLLVTEVMATYPVWKHLRKSLPSSQSDQYVKPEPRQKGLNPLLMVLGSGIAISLFIFLLGEHFFEKGPGVVVKADKLATASTVPVKKYLVDSTASSGLVFTLLAKWEDGKFYCNSRVLLRDSAALAFSDIRFSLLDKEGFLIKEFHFLQNDFVFESEPVGRVTAVLNRFNADLSLEEYQRIQKLQVVLNRKVNAK